MAFISSSATSSKTSEKTRQILAAAILGITIIMGMGFTSMDVAHNAAHDTRHSVAFPCH